MTEFPKHVMQPTTNCMKQISKPSGISKTTTALRLSQKKRKTMYFITMNDHWKAMQAIVERLDIIEERLG